MTDIHFLRADTAESIQRIATLARIIWEEHYPAIIGAEQVRYMVDKFQTAEAMQRQADEEGYEYYLIRCEDKDIGYIGLRMDTDHCFLSKIYILSEKRGCGIGSRAMIFIDGLCRKEGIGALRLMVNRYNEKSIAAYKKMGFRIVREQVTDIGDGYVMDDYAMEKEVGG